MSPRQGVGSNVAGRLAKLAMPSGLDAASLSHDEEIVSATDGILMFLYR